MAKGSSFVSLAGIDLDSSGSVPLYRQLYRQIREAILGRRLAAGARLPPTRSLADDLGLSRNTVVTAFEQLLAEGYIEGRVGSGTYVSQALPGEALAVRPRSFKLAAAGSRRLAARGRLIASRLAGAWPDEGNPRAFRPGLPALDAFPYEEWARQAARCLRGLPRHLLAYGDPAGYAPLRQAIAEYLGAARGVVCSADQVVVTAGSQQGLDLAARLLLDPGDTVWIEDPGYRGARGALAAAGAHLEPIPVDEQGLQVDWGMAHCPHASMVYVTPSHQYPLGITMSLARRLMLLDWAARSGAWVLEDDYDSEYRYVGHPLTALQGLDNAGRVIYIGTCSKVLFPAVRLGYLVVPPDLVQAFVAARSLADRQSPTLDQAVLADWIAEGRFARHIRRMRALYAERQAALIRAVERQLGDWIEVSSAEAGLHVLGWLPEGMDDRAASRRAAANKVEAPPLSAYSIVPPRRGGLVLGYAGFGEAEIRQAAGRLRAALQSIR